MVLWDVHQHGRLAAFQVRLQLGHQDSAVVGLAVADDSFESLLEISQAAVREPTRVVDGSYVCRFPVRSTALIVGCWAR